MVSKPEDWVDPEDAPELTAEWFEKATPMIGGCEVTMEEFRAAAWRSFPPEARPSIVPKLPITIKLDVDIIAAFQARGDGWESRMNEALREWMKAQLV